MDEYNKQATLPDNMRAWRSRRSLSQSGAAKFLGMPLISYQNWEQGKRKPTGFVIEALTKILKR